MNSSNNRRAVRSAIRRQRRKLPSQLQNQHQLDVLRLIKRSSLLRRYQHFALYLHADGELQTDLIIDYLLSLKKTVYLPVLYPLSENRLWFVPYDKQNRMKRNRFRIAEPTAINRRRSARYLQVVFMPLVGFDLSGNRLGMGGGFYDRSLSNFKLLNHSQLPIRIGLAHQLQQVDDIKSQPWDIKLHGVITEQQFYSF